MFGDPIENEKGWRTIPLLQTGKCKNGMNYSSKDCGVEMHCLGVADFQDNAVIDDMSVLPMVSLKERPNTDYLLQNGDIVFVRSNGNRALVGRSVVVYPGDEPVVYSGFCIRYRKEREELLTDYLLRFFKTDSVRAKMAGRGANIQNLNQQILAALNIPIPPIEMQKEFSVFVKQSDKSKFISFKSQFIEMFGDPDNNSKNWPLVSLKDCLVAIDSGKSITCENYPRTGDLPAILKLSAVTYGEYQPEENKQLPLAEQFIKEAEVHVGDLLFSRKNTLEYVGMTALVKQTPPKLMMPDLIFRLVPQENVRPQYLHQLINHPMYRGTISGLANGSAGSMPNISKQKLNNLAIPLPPVELQMEIEPFIEQSDKSKFELKQAIEDINNLMRVFMAQNTDKED